MRSHGWEKRYLVFLSRWKYFYAQCQHIRWSEVADFGIECVHSSLDIRHTWHSSAIHNFIETIILQQYTDILITKGCSNAAGMRTNMFDSLDSAQSVPISQSGLYTKWFETIIIFFSTSDWRNFTYFQQ